MAPFKSILLILILVLNASFLEAWGKVGHVLVAAIAQTGLRPTTLSNVRTLIGDDVNLESIANWADEVKYAPAYRFSGALHYVNPYDDEPGTCSLRNGMHCPGGMCVIGAITNYTLRLDPTTYPYSFSSTRLSQRVRAEALRFVVHLVGDVHQPLHVSGRQRGGNDAQVRFFSREVNLHEVWDSLLIDRRIETGFGGDVQAFLRHLLSLVRIKNNSVTYHGIDRSDSRSGSSSLSSVHLITSPLSYDEEYEDDVWAWATETNKENCAVVWMPGFEGTKKGTEYCDSAVKVIETQLVRAGVRLSLILNRLLSKKSVHQV